MKFPGFLSRLLIGFCAAAVILSCNRPEEKPAVVGTSYPGTVLISAAGKSTTLGSNDSGAASDEQPPMQVSFSYDFNMDTAEVTIASYRAILGSLPPEYDSIVVTDSLCPVAYVSWYDAILYCNARSKSERLDSVYRYISASHTSTGSTYGLNGLTINFSADGFRLPTEAEWVYAASGGESIAYPWGQATDSSLAAQYAWYQENSAGKTHSVALLSPNRFGLHDIAGNVMEWANDTKGAFCAAPVTDFAGAEQGITTQRVLKGGSFMNTINMLRVPRRSDLYPTDAATRSRYVGFRCAAGTVKVPHYLSGCTVVTDTVNPVYLEAGSVAAFLGTKRAKLAFVNATGPLCTLCWIDWSEAVPMVHRFADVKSVYCPVISPDGRWVAWCSGPEGMGNNSSVHARQLSVSAAAGVALVDSPAYTPRWWVDTSTYDTFVIYSTTSVPNDLTEWRQGQTRMVRFSGGKFTGSSVMLTTNGAYHDGRSADGRYLASGYVHLLMKDLHTSEERLLFTGPENGKGAGDTSQVCNVSISPDLTHDNRVLFLDFGSGRNASTLTRNTYSLHQYIFMTGWDNQTIAWYRVPAGYQAWDHSEWSTNYRFAAASVQQPNGNHPAIFAIDLQASTYLELCSGTDLLYPYMWVDNGTLYTVLSADSIGMYDDPHVNNPQALFAWKMQDFWNRAQNLGMVFVGSSVVAAGIDVTSIHSVTAGYNFGIHQGDLKSVFDAIQNYILPHCPNLKVLGMSLDIFNFVYPEGINIQYPAVTASNGYLYDIHHNFWRAGLPTGFIVAINALPRPQIPFSADSMDTLGLVHGSCGEWGSNPPPVYGTAPWHVTDAVCMQNLFTFEGIVDECAARNIKVLLVQFPFSPGFAATPWFGPNGPNSETAHIFIDTITSITKRHANLFFYDANLFGTHDYSDDDANDEGHLCTIGARKLSTRIDSILTVILGH